MSNFRVCLCSPLRPLGFENGRKVTQVNRAEQRNDIFLAVTSNGALLTPTQPQQFPIN